MNEYPPAITKSRLCTDLRELGVEAGRVLMLHVSVKAIGQVVGGPDMVIESLLDVLGPEGTLMMYVSSEDSPHDLAYWPQEWQEAYLMEAPPFDPRRTRAYRKWSILTEYLRTWPGAERSRHPDGSFAAVGAKATWITADHPLHYALGPGSPADKLVQADGQVLLLGAPFESLTIIHHAEALARIDHKRTYHFNAPMLIEGETKWVDIDDFDSQGHIFDWQGESYFNIIPREYLASGRGHSGKVGAAQSYLLDAADFDRFAIEWLEGHMGNPNV